MLLLYETEYSKAIVPHKLYHYLGMSKPIMAIADENGEVSHIIKTTRTGKVTSVKRPEGVYKMLVNYIEEHKNYGHIKYSPNLEEIGKYDIIKMTDKLAKTIKSCSGFQG